MAKTSTYFKKQKDSLIFIGDKLEIFVPKRYEIHGYLTVASTIKTIGFFDMTINGSIETGYKLAAMIEINPDTVENVTRDGDAFLKLTLNKGDVFIQELKYVEDPKIVYVLFYEMVHSGHYPNFIKYEDCASIFDYIIRTTGGNFDSSHTIWELVFMQVARSKTQISKLHRLTNMKDDPQFIGLHSIANVATSTSSKITGAYARPGLESSIANASEQNSAVEDALRT